MNPVNLIIGRFQPCHKGHTNLIQKAVDNGNRTIVVIGSAYQSRSIKNPFTAEERMRFLRGMFPGKLEFGYIPDFLNSDFRWVVRLKYILADMNVVFSDCTLYIHGKDEAMYRNLLPTMNIVVASHTDLSICNSTKVREQYFSNWDPTQIAWLPQTTVNFLEEFKAQHPVEYKDLVDEYRFITEYNKSWSYTPYPVNFVTVDCAVICQNHILLIRRKHVPGRGYLALPGGFVNKHETLHAAAVRELKEETSLDLSGSTYSHTRVFDSPSRSLRGRIITHCFVWYLLGELDEYQIEASDDAESARWYSLGKVLDYNLTTLYSDHREIIENVLTK